MTCWHPEWGECARCARVRDLACCRVPGEYYRADLCVPCCKDVASEGLIARRRLAVVGGRDALDR